MTHRRRPAGAVPATGRGDLGATAAEYAIAVSLIAVVIVAGVAALGQAVLGLFAVPAGL